LTATHLLATCGDQLLVLDRSPGGALEIVGQAPASGSGLHAGGSTAFVVDEFQVELFDVTDPVHPHSVRTMDPPDGFRYLTDVMVAGDWLYATSWSEDYPYWSAILSADVSDPGNASWDNITHLPLDESVFGTAGEGHLYLMTGAGNGMVFSLADPAAPERVGSFLPPLDPQRASFAAGGLLLGNSVGVSTYDLGDPRAPRRLAAHDSRGYASDAAMLDDHLMVAGYAGLRVYGPVSPLQDVSSSSPEELELTVPAGYAPGPYDLWIADPEAAVGTRAGNAFRVLESCELTASLEPVVDPDGATISTPLPWRVVLAGDEGFFAEEGSHHALLALPPLPEELGLRFEEAGDGDAPLVSFEVHLAPEAEAGFVVLRGASPEAAEAAWQQIADAGGVAWPARDDHSYGDVPLVVRRTPPADGTLSDPVSPTGDTVIGAGTRIYEYVLTGDGMLASARADGPSVDLVVAYGGETPSGCTTGGDVGLVPTAQALCEELAASDPDHIYPCQ
jgi:hypothetical protein